MPRHAAQRPASAGKGARTLSGEAERALGPLEALQDAASIIDALRASKPRKYRNTPTTVDGQRFDSRKEADRYGHLRMLEQAGVICDLMVHEAFPLVVHGIDCGAYVSDFTYLTETGERVIEDVKSSVTRKLPTYRLKRKLVWAIYGLRIVEV